MRLIDIEAPCKIEIELYGEKCRATVTAPTIDAVPVVHGVWIIDGEFIDCSVCKREKWSRVPYENLVKRFRFCPNCGAKMEV